MKKTENKKKAYRTDAVYHRTPSGRYQEIGYSWRGFPADGIWLVQDGKSNMTCLIGLKEDVPILALNYRIHAEDLCSYIHKRFNGRARSRMDEAQAACDYFASEAAKKIESGK